MKHVGKSAYRLASNPREKVFAEAWEHENETCSTLGWLLCKESHGIATDEQMSTAATVIQWLGSPVGFGWLTDTLDKAGYMAEGEEMKDTESWLEMELTVTLHLTEAEAGFLEGMSGFDSAKVLAAIRSVCGTAYTESHYQVSPADGFVTLMGKCAGLSKHLDFAKKLRASALQQVSKKTGE